MRDGDEANPSDDTDGDGLINVLDVDSDNDALFDGTEVGKACDDPATNVKAGHCIADGDNGKTTTSPLDPDTDHGGVKDGSEDFNRNGVVDAGETDPTAGHGGDDKNVVDSDGDGLSDGTEISIGTDPHDADSDDDGVLDGAEANPSDDGDGDGLINALDPDSDNDGLFDGTEVGNDCKNAATDSSKNTCIADGDKGATTTSPLEPDTDRGGVSDGDEDSNHNGVVDTGETDPNDPTDDRVVDGGVGGSSGIGGSGVGAAGAGPAGGSMGLTDAGPDVGGAMGLDGGGGTATTAGTAGANTGVLEGGGCACRAAPGNAGTLGGLALGVAALGLWSARRRRKAR